MREKVTINRIWGLAYPMILYLLIQRIVAEVFVFVVKYVKSASGEYHSREALIDSIRTVYSNNIMLCTLIAAAISIPILFYFKNRDTLSDTMRGICKKYERVPFYKFFLIVPLSVFAMFSANYFVSLLTLFMPKFMLDSYVPASSAIYSSTFFMQFLAAGIVGPIAEELIFRGLIYNRMKKMLSITAAAVCSAILFGVFHGNWVQAPYAIIIGLVCVYAYERYKSFLAPVLVHMSANIMSVIVSQLIRGVAGKEIQNIEISRMDQAVSLISVILFTGMIVFLMIKIINHVVNPKEIEE